MANVLKPDTPSDRIPAARSVSGLAGFNLSDLADEGREQLQRCRAQIRQMLDESEAQAKAIRSEAETSGYQAGLERAAIDADRKLAEQADARAKESLRLIRSAVQQLHTMHEQWMQQYSQSLSAIALAASERILRRKLKDEPQLIALWAEEAIRSTRSSASLTLAVHPETMAQLGQSLDELLAAPGLPEQTHVEPDESVAPSEVVVRQTGGEIHAGLTAQLERLAEMLS
jgi:flagellar assembly protein FliH